MWRNCKSETLKIVNKIKKILSILFVIDNYEKNNKYHLDLIYL